MKYRIFGHPRLLMRGLSGAKVEIGLATMAYNLKRITNVLGAAKLTKRFIASDGTRPENAQFRILSRRREQLRPSFTNS
jgi:hypothetical protein